MSTPALLCIDVQKAFDEPSWGIRNNPEAETNIERLLFMWRDQNRPVIHVQHCSSEPASTLAPGGPGHGFKPQAMPLASEPIFSKSVNSAFIGTGLEQYLRDQKIESLVIVGFTTDHCVSTTVRMAANLDFDVTLVSDATATFDRRSQSGHYFSAQDIHSIHLVSLDGEFCKVSDTHSLLQSRLEAP